MFFMIYEVNTIILHFAFCIQHSGNSPVNYNLPIQYAAKRDCFRSPFYIYLLQPGALVGVGIFAEQIADTEIEDVGRAAPLLQGLNGKEGL